MLIYIHLLIYLFEKNKTKIDNYVKKYDEWIKLKPNKKEDLAVW